jgi:hypothetical protein
MMNEKIEIDMTIFQRLERIEAILERINKEIRKDDIWKAAFDVKWEQLMKEHVKIQEHVKENWERINRLEQEPIQAKAKMWDTVTGRIIIIITTIIGTTVLNQISTILKLFLEAK